MVLPSWVKSKRPAPDASGLGAAERGAGSAASKADIARVASRNRRERGGVGYMGCLSKERANWRSRSEAGKGRAITGAELERRGRDTTSIKFRRDCENFEGFG